MHHNVAFHQTPDDPCTSTRQHKSYLFDGYGQCARGTNFGDRRKSLRFSSLSAAERMHAPSERQCTHLHMYQMVHLAVYACVGAYVCVQVQAPVHVHVRMRACTTHPQCTCTCMQAQMHIHTYACVYAHTQISFSIALSSQTRGSSSARQHSWCALSRQPVPKRSRHSTHYL